jgi:hypothetical protein
MEFLVKLFEILRVTAKLLQKSLVEAARGIKSVFDRHSPDTLSREDIERGSAHFFIVDVGYKAFTRKALEKRAEMPHGITEVSRNLFKRKLLGDMVVDEFYNSIHRKASKSVILI